jgi:chloride channel protein, CIC family
MDKTEKNRKYRTKLFIINLISHLQRIAEKIFRTEHTSYIFYSVIIGLFAGLAAVLFHNSIEFFNKIFFDQTKDGLFFLGAAAVIVLPAIGMFIQSLMILSAPDIAKQRGVSEVIKAVASRDGKIPFRTTIFHFIAPVISIGSGNTVGPEGPAAQLGGGVANKIAILLRISDSRKKVFTAAGAGAAIAAIFNTPLGGIFFALEIILLNEFQTATFSALILSSVTASAVSRAFLGNKSVFVFSSPSVGEYHNLYIYAILGIVAGFVSLFFINYSNISSEIIQKKILNKVPQWLWMTIVGLVMGVSGYFYKDIFGVGYMGINDILSQAVVWKTAIILLVLKFILVPLILNSGGFGGVFAPSLFMGACLGSLFATGLNYFFGLHVDTTAFILVGMGAALGGINSIPIASILIIFEMTKDYSFILPLMLAVVSSTMIVQIILKRSVHEHHLEKQGYRLASKGDINVLKSVTVKQVMSNEAVLIPEETPLPIVIKKLMESKHSTFYTVNKQNILSGTINETELRQIITEYEHIREVLVARDIASLGVTTVLENDDLDSVMKLFEKKGADEFPVMDTVQKNNVIGTVRRHEVISAYNRESLKKNMPEFLSHELETVSNKKPSRVFDEFSVAEVKAPESFIGKTIAELEIRKKYGLAVLMIRTNNSPYSENQDDNTLLLPEPNYLFKNNDVVLLFGSNKKIDAFNS